MSERTLFTRWVRATWAGWVLGIPLIAALALLGEAIGIGGVQVLVGIGMGTGVGWMQGRVIRSVLNRIAPWVWSCIVGLGVPFGVVDVAKALHWNLPYSLYLSVALGGLIVGTWQTALLRSHVRNAGWWIAGSILGWNLAAGMVAIADALFRSHSIRGLAGLLIYLGSIAGGGLLLGLVTGAVLVWLRQQKLAV